MTVEARVESRPPEALGSRRRGWVRYPTLPGTGSLAGRGPLLVIALLAVLARLPYLAAPISSDEGGFLLVGGQWSPGTSLYGNLWVDRPPLLVGLFALAHLAGGLPALRVLGCIAVAVTVVAVGLAARRTLGARAGVWSAGVAAVLLVTPLTGALPVNGELLAAPFVALGVLSVVCALDASSARRAVALGAAAGACGAAAMMVKQNMLDVGVFALVLVVLTGWTRRAEVWRLALVLLAAVGTALVTAGLLLALAALRGTSPSEVLFAMYGFRVRASALIASSSLTGRIARIQRMGELELFTGAPLLLLGLVAVVWRSRRERRTSPRFALAVATLVLTLWGVFSVVAGGSYWTHYLIELVVPTSLAAGLLVAELRRVGPLLAAVVLVASTVGWAGGLSSHESAPGLVVGQSLAAVRQPGDSGASLLGDPDILEVSGLRPAYPYAWSLPSRTLDPHQRTLARVLTGPDAPTWVIVRNSTTADTIARQAAGPALRQRYRVVAQVCDHVVMLRVGLTRATPASPASCDVPVSTFLDFDLPD